MGRLSALPPRIGRLRIGVADPLPPPPKATDPFYLTPAWRRLVASIIKARGRQCELCGRDHDPDTGDPIRIFGDHIVEIKDGGALLDPANIRLLCGACHTRKTARARAARRGPFLGKKIL